MSIDIQNVNTKTTNQTYNFNILILYKKRDVYKYFFLNICRKYNMKMEVCDS